MKLRDKERRAGFSLTEESGPDGLQAVLYWNDVYVGVVRRQIQIANYVSLVNAIRGWRPKTESVELRAVK